MNDSGLYTISISIECAAIDGMRNVHVKGILKWKLKELLHIYNNIERVSNRGLLAK